MAVEGAIADATRGVLPLSWDMLSSESMFGDALLRQTIDTKKEEVLGAVGSPAAEDSLPLIVIRYLAKLVALELINPAMDAWRGKPTSLVATGTNEQETYSDPIVALQQLRKDLLEQTRNEWALVAPLISFRRLSSGPRPASNTIGDEFLTPSPQEFPRPYKVTDRT
jgi:hypothetical protein